LSFEKVEGEVGVLPPPARARKREIGHGDEGSRAMSGQDEGTRPEARQETREERLKAALRENLRRRKAQVRGREAAEPAAQVPPADRKTGDER
jgi:hypothetical protein